MKRLIKIMASFLLVLIMIVLGVVAYIFYFPETVINVKTLRYVLDRTSVVKDVHWKKGELHIGWKKWNDRPFKGRFEDLCLKYESEGVDLKTCIAEVSWDLDVQFSFAEGFSVTSPGPMVFHARDTTLVLKETKQEDSPVPDLQGYWKKFWGPLVPDLSIELLKTKILSSGKTYAFDLHAQKIGKTFTADAFTYHLKANPKRFELLGPDRLALPFSFFKERPLDLRHLKMIGDVDHKGIDVKLTSALSASGIEVRAFVPWPDGDLTGLVYQEKILKTLKGEMILSDVKQFYEGVVPLKYAVLPAPLNVMNGVISVKLRTEMPVIIVDVDIDLKSPKQALNMAFNVQAPINLKERKLESVSVAIDFRKVLIQMPRLSKKALPPQFKPDSRFYHTPFGSNPPQIKKAVAEKPLDFDLDLSAKDNKALHLRSNLLDEVLRLNFDLSIRKGELSHGFVQILPLKTSVFKRPVHVKDFKVTFKAPLSPVIEGNIEFPLPSYRVFMHVEGPVDDPRYSFSSKPPLPKDDIYSVLLFGRTMADLGLDDQNSVRRTNQILSQGVFSLAVLYFLAGSPVQYVGYDPETGNGIAQVGVGKQTSFTVKGRDGYNSAGVRRSIGKGWYVDTASENSTTNPNGSRNYSVLLERIIAY